MRLVRATARPLAPAMTYRWGSRCEQCLEIRGGPGSRTAGTLSVKPAGERVFVRLQLHYAFLHRVLCDELINEHGFVLSDAMCAIGRLGFHGWVPPRVVVNDGIGGGQIESSPACLEADQKQRQGACLKAGDD